MLKTYLSHLQLRVQAIEKLIGPLSEYSEKDIKEIRDGISDFASKLPKDISRKFDRIKKDIEKYQVVIDLVPLNDKLTLVQSQIEDLNAIATQLSQIEKLLPALNTESYLKFREVYADLHLFNTASELQLSLGQKAVVKKDSQLSLSQLRAEHRQSMNEILELNGQIIKNLSIKLQALQNKKGRQFA